jgi:TIGR03009 family protein
MTSRAGLRTALTFAICLIVAVAPLTAQTTPPPGNGTAQPTQNAALPSGALPQPQLLPLAPPFILTPGEEANLNQLLADWETANSKIKTFTCTFTRWEYDPAIVGGDPNQCTALSKGELKYAYPDKGMFHVTELTNYVPDPKTGKMAEQKAEPSEWWTCDGKSMFEVTVRNNEGKVERLVVEKPLPPEMRGKAITEGPLPFVFGANAENLKNRYYMRVITPPVSAKTEVWLEAFPKLQKDAANFSRVTLILNKTDLQPSAIRIFNPGANAQNSSRTVIRLEDASINSPLDALKSFFTNFARPNPIGYKHVLEQNLAPPPTAIQPPGGNSTNNSQASRPQPQAK